MKTMLVAAKFETRNSKFKIRQADFARSHYFRIRISNFEFRGVSRA